MAAESPQDIAWIDNVLMRLNSLYKRLDICIVHVMPLAELTLVIDRFSKVMMTESNLCEAEAPIKVIGDIHGQFQHMNQLFDMIGRVPEEKFMFLGDYVDRGPQSIEVVVYLMCLKIRYKDRIYILRGNHETPAVNKIYGFYNECAMKYGVGSWWDFQACFNRIPMAGLISKKILCMHGGLSPELVSLDTIRNIPRPCEPLDRGLLIDLLWSDPTNKGDGWFHSIRGISYMFGKGIVKQFCDALKIDLIIRAHQVVQDGYEMMAGRQLITVFSAPNYCEQFTNAAAVVCIDADLSISFQQFTMPMPKLPPGQKKPKAAPSIACEPQMAKAKADKEWFKKFTGFKKPEAPPPPPPPAAAAPAEAAPAPAAPAAEAAKPAEGAAPAAPAAAGEPAPAPAGPSPSDTKVAPPAGQSPSDTKVTEEKKPDAPAADAAKPAEGAAAPAAPAAPAADAAAPAAPAAAPAAPAADAAAPAAPAAAPPAETPTPPAAPADAPPAPAAA